MLMGSEHDKKNLWGEWEKQNRIPKACHTAFIQLCQLSLLPLVYKHRYLLFIWLHLSLTDQFSSRTEMESAKPAGASGYRESAKQASTLNCILLTDILDYYSFLQLTILSLFFPKWIHIWGLLTFESGRILI